MVLLLAGERSAIDCSQTIRNCICQSMLWWDDRADRADRAWMMELSKLQIRADICGTGAAAATIYRSDGGQLVNSQKMVLSMAERYSRASKGEEQMAACGCRTVPPVSGLIDRPGDCQRIGPTQKLVESQSVAIGEVCFGSINQL